MLADVNGETLGLLDAVRGGEGLAGEIDPHTPMIVLTSRAGELERVRVFDRGGDDVVSKPFSYPELRGRIRALLRRAYDPHVTPVTRIGALTVDHRAPGGQLHSFSIPTALPAPRPSGPSAWPASSATQSLAATVRSAAPCGSSYGRCSRPHLSP